LVPIFSISPKSFVEDIYQTINILSSIFLKNDNFFKKNDILLNSSLSVRKNEFNEIENLRDRKSIQKYLKFPLTTRLRVIPTLPSPQSLPAGRQGERKEV
jgi:hypothetical protein